MRTIKLCITGGSGFIGTNAMNLALSLGIDVFNIDINEPPIKEHLSYWRKIDILNYEGLSNIISKENPTHILHLAAVTGMGNYPESYFDANTIGVKNLVRIINQNQFLRKVLFTSSLLVCKNGYVPKYEDEYCPPNAYGKSKAQGEKIVREFCSKKWVIVRPTSIWGPWFGHSYYMFFKMIKMGLYLNPGKKKIYKPLSYVENTVYMMFTLLINDKLENHRGTYYLADYPNISIQEWANNISRGFGRGDVITLPVVIMRVIALFGDMLSIVGFKNFPITTFRLNNMLTCAEYPIDNTMKDVGNLPIHIKDGIANTIRWINGKDR